MTRPAAEGDSLEDVAVARRAVGLAAVVILVLVSAASVGITIINRNWLAVQSLFYEQFAAFEPSGMSILAGFAVVVLILLRSRRADEDPGQEVPRWLTDSGWTRAGIAIAVLFVAALGTHLVFHGYIFIDDEYSGWFQSVIYSQGKRTATVPAEWCRWIASMTPTTVAIDKPCTWRLSYLPIHSMIRGGFLALRLDTFAEPVLAALSVLLTASISRRVWPDRPDRAVLSALYLAASSQVLVMSMTGFAMTAHLFFSLLWLWFYVNPARWALILLPWIGVVALGVHSPIPHVLFVTPFLFRFLIQRRFAVVVYVGLVYFAGIEFWHGIYYSVGGDAALPIAGPALIAQRAVAIGSRFAFDGLANVMSLTLLATWSVPVAVIAVLVAFVLWNRLDGFARWLALSLLCTLVARAFLSGIQGAGWGYRYGFAVLGNFAILAAIGTDFIGETLGRRKTYRLVAAGLVAAMFVQLPLRSVQAERIVRPYYQTSEWMAHFPADVLIFDPGSVRYARQLVRNDPFLRQPPVIMDGSALGAAGIDAVKAAFPGRVHVITNEELTRFGLKY